MYVALTVLAVLAALVYYTMPEVREFVTQKTGITFLSDPLVAFLLALVLVAIGANRVTVWYAAISNVWSLALLLAVTCALLAVRQYGPYLRQAAVYLGQNFDQSVGRLCAGTVGLIVVAVVIYFSQRRKS